MIKPTQRRHSRWHEVIIFNSIFHFAIGFLLVVALPNWIRWGELLFRWPLREVELNTLIANALAYSLVFFLLHKFKNYPGTKSLPFILPTVVFAWLLVMAALIFLRIESYARQVLTYSILLTLAWAFISHFLSRRFNQTKLALVPFGRALELADSKVASCRLLSTPSLEGSRFDGVVADLHSNDLPQEWEKFLAQCTLARIPVYHSQHILESLTGRVKINHLSENIFGELLPSRFYSLLKRIIDLTLVILVSPIFIPIMLITALLIKIDSSGSVFYNQQRMGYLGKSFKMYKFRSMRNDLQGKGFTEGEDDPRITKVGKIIRKFRIDEMPQILNVLKGDMSLIGPRPEQRAFVDDFEKSIPFYSYRHVVKPGITGWAQVVHGYAADTEDTCIKLEHDFYYIKNFSLWLDILIIVKTIRTILTGFGAR